MDVECDVTSGELSVRDWNRAGTLTVCRAEIADSRRSKEGEV